MHLDASGQPRQEFECSSTDWFCVENSRPRYPWLIGERCVRKNKRRYTSGNLLPQDVAMAIHLESFKRGLRQSHGGHVYQWLLIMLAMCCFKVQELCNSIPLAARKRLLLSSPSFGVPKDQPLWETSCWTSRAFDLIQQGFS